MNTWTRDDLPSAGGLAHTYAATSGDIIERFEAIVDELVWRLNAHHPKRGVSTADLATAERWRDAFRAADEALRQAERERDEASSRVDQVRDERDEAVIVADGWRAAAEHRGRLLDQSAPAVTRDEVWRVVAAHDPGDDELGVSRVNTVTDAVWALLGRGKSVQAVECQPTVSRDEIEQALMDADPDTVDPHTDAMCDLLGIEPDVDPVEAKARAEADNRYSGTLNHAFVEGAMWATRHVPGQEAGDE